MDDHEKARIERNRLEIERLNRLERRHRFRTYAAAALATGNCNAKDAAAIAVRMGHLEDQLMDPDHAPMSRDDVADRLRELALNADDEIQGTGKALRQLAADVAARGVA